MILGGHLPYGYTGKVKVKGVMKFIDAGLVDDKLICTQLIPGMSQVLSEKSWICYICPDNEKTF